MVSIRSEKAICAHPVSQKFPHRYLRNDSNVRAGQGYVCISGLNLLRFLFFGLVDLFFVSCSFFALNNTLCKLH